MFFAREYLKSFFQKRQELALKTGGLLGPKSGSILGSIPGMVA